MIFFASQSGCDTAAHSLRNGVGKGESYDISSWCGGGKSEDV